jgi:hypothetical protein
MAKKIFAATVALALLGGGLAVAQQTASREPDRPGLSVEDLAALTDARIAGLKAGLKLTAEQEKNWPAAEAALRELAKLRADRMMERAAQRDAGSSGNEPPRPDLFERLRRSADSVSARGAALKKLVEAAEPLYRSLDDGQKRRMGMLMPMLMPMIGGEGMHRGWHHGAEGHHMHSHRRSADGHYEQDHRRERGDRRSYGDDMRGHWRDRRSEHDDVRGYRRDHRFDGDDMRSRWRDRRADSDEMRGCWRGCYDDDRRGRWRDRDDDDTPGRERRPYDDRR